MGGNRHERAKFHKFLTSWYRDRNKTATNQFHKRTAGQTSPALWFLGVLYAAPDERIVAFGPPLQPGFRSPEVMILRVPAYFPRPIQFSLTSWASTILQTFVRTLMYVICSQRNTLQNPFRLDYS